MLPERRRARMIAAERRDRVGILGAGRGKDGGEPRDAAVLVAVLPRLRFELVGVLETEDVDGARRRGFRGHREGREGNNEGDDRHKD